ncbi:MAG: flavodoxin-dependent (E)-4-hydroxy-3-methylbut-2-enyl-diphosphate synthase [Candidatus Omnitrophica bacterium]|nr:flavodoxin-dependent (E)-4-hydroxy-3-methylbut-2-enyl-diphosphate synthase [Candidatus Omnitrophota bacterium]
MRKTRIVKVGRIYIGGGHPVSVQTMTKIPTKDEKKVLGQIKKIEKAGGEIVRVSVMNKEDAKAIARIKKEIELPLVADIHYDYRLAFYAIESGADKLRVNPSNIRQDGLKMIIREAGDKKIPLRLGLNSGSVKITGRGIVSDIVDATLDAVKLCEDNHFFDIVLSVKTPYVSETINAYRVISEKCNYPLHLGITESGQGDIGFAKSVLGIGILLSEGIGDTIRVSLTDTPEKEIKVGQAILQALGVRRFEPEIISCPVCGRCRVPLQMTVSRLRRKILRMAKIYPEMKNLTIAIMGCSVNGPGEAKQADLGIAGGKERFVFFVKGNIIGSYSVEEIEEKFFKKIKEIANG